jgi:hypothetical protein
LATKAYDTLELELQDGTEVIVRPLDLKRLRKVMKIIDDMNVASVKSFRKSRESEDAVVTDGDEDNLVFLIAACKICLEKQLPELVKDTDAFEEALDLPTLWKILDVGAGISMGNPNPEREAALPGLI